MKRNTDTFAVKHGDVWRFDLICTNIALGTKRKKKTAILSTTCTPPVQYPDFDNDE